MIDQEFLSSCTDEQISKGVAWLVIKAWGVNYYCCKGLLKSIDGGGLNYCTSPNDIMPIAFENKISIEHDDKHGWEAASGVSYDDSYYYPVRNFEEVSSNTNPLRAICEVYILMMVAK